MAFVTNQPGDNDGITAPQLRNQFNGLHDEITAIPTLDTPYADPEKEELRQAYNALVLMLRR